MMLCRFIKYSLSLSAFGIFCRNTLGTQQSSANSSKFTSGTNNIEGTLGYATKSIYLKVRWIFINYHKSGTVFSEKLMKAASNLLGTVSRKLTYYHISDRKTNLFPDLLELETGCRSKVLPAKRTEDFDYQRLLEECTDICTLHAPNMGDFDWTAGTKSTLAQHLYSINKRSK